MATDFCDNMRHFKIPSIRQGSYYKPDTFMSIEYRTRSRIGGNNRRALKGTYM